MLRVSCPRDSESLRHLGVPHMIQVFRRQHQSPCTLRSVVVPTVRCFGEGGDVLDAPLPECRASEGRQHVTSKSQLDHSVGSGGKVRQGKPRSGKARQGKGTPKQLDTAEGNGGVLFVTNGRLPGSASDHLQKYPLPHAPCLMQFFFFRGGVFPRQNSQEKLPVC